QRGDAERTGVDDHGRLVRSAGRVRGTPGRCRARGSRPEADRVHAVAGVAGGAPAHELRLPGGDGDAAADRVPTLGRAPGVVPTRPGHRGRSRARRVDRAVALDHGMNRRRPDQPVGRVAVAAVAVAVAVPVVAVLGRALRIDGAWSLDALERILSNGRTWRLVAVTVAQAIVSTASTAAIGVPLAWVLARFRFPGRS